MVNSKKRMLIGAVLFCILAATIVIGSASLRGQVSRRAAEVDPCGIDAKSADCLQKRITQLEAQLAELQTRVDGLQQTIGDSKVGKADGYDDLWSAITTLKIRVSDLEKR
jgi:TolA-binding protein